MYRINNNRGGSLKQRIIKILKQNNWKINKKVR